MTYSKANKTWILDNREFYIIHPIQPIFQLRGVVHQLQGVKNKCP